jgi:pilus assembly protein CpaB
MKPARLMILGVAVVGGWPCRCAGDEPCRQRHGRHPGKVGGREGTDRQRAGLQRQSAGRRGFDDKAVHWMAWPQGGVVQGLITETDKPDAIKDLQGVVVRLPIFEGEPIRAGKDRRFIQPHHVLAASIRKAGRRHRDLRCDRRRRLHPAERPRRRHHGPQGKTGDNYLTETVLSNVRVLAIDQQIQEKEDGSKSVVGTTATLELTPDQTKVSPSPSRWRSACRWRCAPSPTRRSRIPARLTICSAATTAGPQSRSSNRAPSSRAPPLEGGVKAKCNSKRRAEVMAGCLKFVARRSASLALPGFFGFRASALAKRARHPTAWSASPRPVRASTAG